LRKEKKKWAYFKAEGGDDARVPAGWRPKNSAGLRSEEKKVFEQ